MIAIAFLFVRALCDCFKSRRRLEAEILVLRHQLNVLQQRAPRRLYLTWADRALFVWLYRRFPRILDAITPVRPETIVRWHRKGFGAFWRWKSRPLGGRPRIAKDVRDLIRRMSFENPLWGAPHIHGELLKLGFEVAQSTVSKCWMLPKAMKSWRTALRSERLGCCLNQTRHRNGGSAGRARPAPRLVILCVDVLGFLIGLEPSLELAHQRQQAGHAGDRFEQRP